MTSGARMGLKCGDFVSAFHCERLDGMILTHIGPEYTFFRAFTPQWAYQPESGAGAAVRGGRFNRQGVEARYLAASADVALVEYQTNPRSCRRRRWRVFW